MLLVSKETSLHRILKGDQSTALLSHLAWSLPPGPLLMLDGKEDAHDGHEHHDGHPDEDVAELRVLEQVLSELDADDRLDGHAEAVHPRLGPHALAARVRHVAVVLPKGRQHNGFII